MATTTGDYPIWSRKNLEQQTLINDTPYSYLLMEKRVRLIKNLLTSPLWSYLRQYEVLAEDDEEEIKYQATTRKSIERLLDHIGKGPKWKFHALMKSCVETDQEHVVTEILEQDIADYQDIEDEVDHRTAGFSPELLQAIKQHCESSHRNLMRRKLFDFQGESASAEIIDTAKCYITVKTKCKSDHMLVFEIPEVTILDDFQDEHAPQTICLQGPTGRGKTTLLRHIAYVRSKNFLQHCKENGAKISQDSIRWNTIVYIPAKAIRTTVREAIKAHLYGPQTGVLMRHVEKGKGVAVLLDAVNEVWNAQVMADIKSYVEERQRMGGPTVLVSSRTDLCPIDAILFERFLTLEGFTIEQGIKYVEHYFADVSNPIVQYVETHRDMLVPVLQTPLWLHIFCALTYRGVLRLSDHDLVFNMLKLFEPLEHHLVAREGLEVTPEQSENFYRLCFFGMFTGMGEFPESLLINFAVARNFHVFLDRSERLDAFARRTVYYTPNHDMVYEYFVSRFVSTQPENIQKCLLLSICCSPNMSNVQKMVFQLFLQQGKQEELVLTMLQSMLILNKDLPANGAIFSKNDLEELRHWIRSGILESEPFKFTQKEKCIMKAESMWKRVQVTFERNAQLMRDQAWFITLLENGTLKYIQECLKGCTTTQVQNMIRKTIHRLLPCTTRNSLGERLTYHAIGRTRWGQLKEDTHTRCLDVWNLQDAHKMLTHQAPCADQDVTNVGIYADRYRDLWGEPPGDAWSSTTWSDLLGVVTRVWPGRELYMWLSPSVPLSGLIECLASSDNVLRKLKRFYIYYGALSFPDALHVARTYKNLPLNFRYLYLTIPERVDGAQLIMERNELRKIRNSRADLLMSFPLCVRPSGKTFTWSDKFVWHSSKILHY